MNENLNKFETLKLATQYWHGDENLTKIIIFSFLLLFILFVVGGLLLQRYLQRRNRKRYFEKFAKSKGLNEEEIKILWHYSNKMERDPLLVLEFKAPFEKVVDLYIKENPDADESLVQDMRKKLDFVIQSPNIPIVTTKDIEIFQNGRMVFSDNRSINVALYDKDERYMYWLAVNDDLPSDLSTNQNVKIIFIRTDDGIYTINVPIKEIKKEGGKTLIVLPHTFDLHRTQRREYPRVKLNQPATIIIEDEEKGRIEIDATLDDLSAGGARLCFDKSYEIYKKIRFSDELIIQFKIEEQDMELTLKILDKDVKNKIVCIRGLFVHIQDSTKEKIMEFVQKELLKSSQLKGSG